LLRFLVPVAVVTLSVVLIAFIVIWAVRATFHPLVGTNVASSAARNQSTSPSRCNERDGLPDSACTPGAVSADITQTNIGATICRTGYTSHGVRSDGRPVRPPVTFTEPLKMSGIAAYGYPDKNPAHYEEDHLIPLELGGDGWSQSNLWPEPRYGQHNSGDKDKVENALNRLVCTGRVSLASAQQAIARNWETALASAR
jgi:hypothetical protein